jgi:hypothetical protein
VEQLIAKALGGGRDAFIEGLKVMVEKLQPGSTG